MLKLKNNVNSLLRKNKTFLSSNKKYLSIFSNYTNKKALLNKHSILKPNKMYFCSNDTKKESENSDPDIKRYNYEYEAPENSDFEYKSKLYTLFKLLFSLGLFSFGFYIFFLRKLNLITKNYEIYFLNEYLELKIASYFSKKIQQIFEHYIYKHESEHALCALEIYKTLLENNQMLKNTNNLIAKENVFIIESEALGCFMLKNGDLFVSSRLMEVCQSNPNHLAFFLSCEIAFQAMGLDSNRILKIFWDLRTQNSYLRQKDNKEEELPRFSLADRKKKDLEFYNRYLLFYPESIVLNYLEEREVFKIALRILHKAGFDVFEAIEIMKFFDEKMQFYPHKYPETNRNVRFRYYDILLNLVKIFKINQK